MYANTYLACSGREIMGKPFTTLIVSVIIIIIITLAESGQRGPEEIKLDAGAYLRCRCNYPLTTSHYRALPPPPQALR